MTHDWRLHAACRGHDPELFYPPANNAGGGKRTHHIDNARRVCRSCPVRVDCLAWAFEVDDRFAVLGATTAEERKPTADAEPPATADVDTVAAALTPAGWRALRDAAPDGTLAPGVPTKLRHWLVSAGIAERSPVYRRNGTALRLTPLGRTLRHHPDLAAAS